MDFAKIAEAAGAHGESGPIRRTSKRDRALPSPPCAAASSAVLARQDYEALNS
jgi:hypothetical protein